MSQTPTTPSSGSAMPTLAAPMMSASSSTASHTSKMWSAEASRRGSNASSVAPNIEAPDTKKTEPAPAPAPTHRSHLVNRKDPMSRVYPKPEAEIEVEEALNREPLRWSLGHWRKHARDASELNLPREVVQQRFQETKADLLRSFAAMQTPKK